MTKWYHYIMWFVGGAFTANFFPHFVRGITGAMFPTPFNFLVGQPAPPIGLSPSWLNVSWALFNIAVGYLLLRYSNFSPKNLTAVIVAFIGFAFSAIQLSMVFQAVPH